MRPELFSALSRILLGTLSPISDATPIPEGTPLASPVDFGLAISESLREYGSDAHENENYAARSGDKRMGHRVIGHTDAGAPIYSYFFDISDNDVTGQRRKGIEVKGPDARRYTVTGDGNFDFNYTGGATPAELGQWVQDVPHRVSFNSPVAKA